jgi:ribosomal protein S18 acetylase RimI-like enzyme
MIIRAQPHDAQAIAAFELAVMDLKLYGRPLDTSAAYSEVLSNAYFLQMADRSIISTGALRLQADGTAYLSNIAVHPAYRRQGFARAMMQYLLQDCREASSVELAVHPDNGAAMALYSSIGFVLFEQRDNYFGDGEPRVIMVRLWP